VPGGREVGQVLASHPDVACVALIGSVPTGRAVMKAASDTLKPVLLELGGKNALIAYPDADLEGVSAAVVDGMNFTWCGQSCGSTSRAFVHAKIYDAVLERAQTSIKRFRPGIPTDPATTMGAIISQVQHDRIMGFIESGRREGARLVSGGGRPSDPKLAKGLFIEPTIFADVTMDMRIGKEEIFGLGIIEELARHGYKLSAGTLYPILHGLERKGYLRSYEHRDGRRIRRVYKATAAGKKALTSAKVKVTELVGELFENELTPRARPKTKKR